MEIVYFILFFLTSWLGVMQIFKFSTYHKYFVKALPVLIGYGALVGALLYYFGLASFFFWYLIALFIHYGINYKKQRENDDMVSQMESSEAKLQLALSFERTLKFWFLSATVYFLAFVITFLYIYNTNFST